MKKIILLLSLALTVSFVSCSKDDNENKNSKTTEKNETKDELLIGTWKLIERGEIVNGKEVKEDLPECGLNTNLTFKKDEKMISIFYYKVEKGCEEEIEIDNWILVDNNIIINYDKKHKATFNIKVLTKKKFKFYVLDEEKTLIYYSFKK